MVAQPHATRVAQARFTKAEGRHLVKGLLFISPWIVGFLAWTVYPVFASLYYSFTQYNLIAPPRPIGLLNYQNLLLQDQTFRLVLTNTLYLVALGVPSGVLTAFLLATLLNNDFRFRPLARTVFFLPSIVPAVASAEVWRWVLNEQYGLINSVVRSLGQTAIPFLTSMELAKPTLIAIGCWGQGSAMLIFLAALQDVPRSLYDAALVDGANALKRFWHITLPMCSPSILFVTITALIGTFQYFTFGWLLTQGGPNQRTEFYSIYLYRNAFAYFKMGYAAALAWILFLIILFFTILFFKSSARWVYYGGEDA
ncbi:MAG: carbohydrate ABC transporter permease [Anaerolineae bacterium]